MMNMGVSMTEYNWDMEDDELEEQPAQQAPGNLPKELRKVIRDAKAEARAARDEAEQLKNTLRTSVIDGVLTSRNVPKKVANFVPKELEATPEAIGKWLEENGDVFGLQQSANESGEPVSNGAPAIVPPAQNAATTAMQRMQSTASSGEAFNAQQALLSKINDPNLTEAELDALIAGAKG